MNRPPRSRPPEARRSVVTLCPSVRPLRPALHFHIIRLCHSHECIPRAFTSSTSSYCSSSSSTTHQACSRWRPESSPSPFNEQRKHQRLRVSAARRRLRRHRRPRQCRRRRRRRRTPPPRTASTRWRQIHVQLRCR